MLVHLSVRRFSFGTNTSGKLPFMRSLGGNLSLLVFTQGSVLAPSIYALFRHWNLFHRAIVDTWGN
jgi:hypothetical protein